MRFLPLIWAGLWRKRARTVLTLLSVAAAFVLFGILHGVTATFDDVIEQMADNRLRTSNRVSVVEALPLAYLPQIESVAGVEHVAHYSFFAGYYQEPGNGVGAGAIAAERFLDSFLRASPGIVVSDEHRQAMLATRTGALVGRDLMDQYGWSVGDRIPLRSNLWSRRDGVPEWTFDIVGTYELEDDTFPAAELWFHYEYFDELRSNGNGTVHFYFSIIADPEQATRIGEEIDVLFVNSSSATQTQSDREWLRAQLGQIGNVQFFVNAIIGAVLFTLLFLIGNTMMQSVRERIPELAVLKTYGYRDATVMALVSAEALILCGAAALIGLVVARTVFPGIFAAMNAPALSMPLSVVVTGILMAAVLALVSVLPPAWRIRRLSIVDALAGR